MEGIRPKGYEGGNILVAHSPLLCIAEKKDHRSVP